MSVSFYHSMTGYLWSIFVSSKRLSNGLRTFAINKICKKLIGRYPALWYKQQCRIDCVLKRSNHRLFTSWHTVEIQSFLVHFAFSVKIFLGSFFEEASFIHHSHLKKRLETLWNQLSFWPILFVFQIVLSLFKRLITSCLRVFTSYIDLIRCFFDVFWKPSSLCLSFYYRSFESVLVWHNNNNK